MRDIKIISNHSSKNHLKYLKELISKADQIFLATAFFKNSGLNAIISELETHVRKNKAIHLIAGKHFGLTEPIALRKILYLFEGHTDAKAYLDKALVNTQVFHPKLFLFRIGNKGVILSGSANITDGGLKNNFEVSIHIETDTKSEIWKEALQLFNSWIQEESSDPLSLLVIEQYENYYNNQKKNRKDIIASPPKQTSEFQFDYRKLKSRLKDFSIEENNIVLREEDYSEAKSLLDEIVNSSHLTQKRFEKILDKLTVGERIWYSGSLYRKRKEVYNYKNEFRTLVKYIHNNKEKSASEVFENAKAMVKKIKGAAINYVTEIMMTYNPKNFANLNSNPIKVLKEEAGVYIKSHSSSFSGIDYERYCALLKEIAKELKLKNMLEVDSFFNDIYWKLKKENSD